MKEKLQKGKQMTKSDEEEAYAMQLEKGMVIDTHLESVDKLQNDDHVPTTVSAEFVKENCPVSVKSKTARKTKMHYAGV